MANVNIRIDKEIKENAEKVFYELGLTPTAAITLFYNQVIRTNSIPFELKLDVPNKETVKAIKEVEKMEKNLNKYKGYKDPNELVDNHK